MEDITQKSVEWHQARLGKFTSSNIWKLLAPLKGNKLFNEVGYTYIKEKFAEVLTQEYQEINTNATNWGNEYEPLARKWFEKISGLEVTECGFFTNPTFPLLGGSPDGLVNSENSIIEIKCPYSTINFIDLVLSLKNSTLKDTHKEYYCQVQLNMYLTKTEKCYFIALDPRINSDKGIFISEIIIDNEYVNMLIQRYVLAGEELERLIKEF